MSRDQADNVLKDLKKFMEQDNDDLRGIAFYEDDEPDDPFGDVRILINNYEAANDGFYGG